MRTRSVLAALLLSMAPVIAQTTYDARILEYKGLDYACDGITTPVLKIQNVGSASMFGCVVETWKNGIMVSTFNWQLAVPAIEGEIRQPSFPAVAGVVPGDELEFKIISVNTIPDEDPVGNIMPVQVDGIPAAASGNTVTIEVLTDQDPGDLTWEIRNHLNQLIASGGPYSDPNQLIETNVLLGSSACYDFKAFDAGRGGGSAARFRVKSGANTLITAEGSALAGGYSKGLKTGSGQPCTQDLVLELDTDASPEETSWEIVDAASLAVVCASSGGYDATAAITEQCCLANGCYRLRVFDGGGDGITNGGYVLRTGAGSAARVVDNKGNYAAGAQSGMNAGDAFCLPISNTRTITTSCDKMEWNVGPCDGGSGAYRSEFLVADGQQAITAVYANYPSGSVERATTGYEFWFFDPNGGYSYRRFRSHAQGEGAPVAPGLRSTHCLLNNWATANHLQQQVLYNVRIRTRLIGAYGAYGPACRIMLDQVAAQCPATRLLDVPGNPYLSCGQSRAWGSGNYVHAWPVRRRNANCNWVNANRYQFRFREQGGFGEVVVNSSNYFKQLNWSINPLLPGSTYDVEVRASFDGGATWCANGAVWGKICTLAIEPSNGVQSGAQRLAPVPGEEGAFRLFPNPTNGAQVNVEIPDLEADSYLIIVHDLTGKQVLEQRSIYTGSGRIHVLDLSQVSPGTYIVSILGNAHGPNESYTFTQRLFVSP